MSSKVFAPKREYLEFLVPYEPRIRQLALATRALVLQEAPDATELIYDAYNAVATGYTFTGRPSDAFVHIAVYAGWVNLGFNRGVELDDPQELLQGSGRWVRHIRISEMADSRKSVLRRLLRAAVNRAVRPNPAEMSKGASGAKSVVRAVYPTKRRPRKQSQRN